jgi:hypothetical protein
LQARSHDIANAGAKARPPRKGNDLVSAVATVMWTRPPRRSVPKGHRSCFLTGNRQSDGRQLSAVAFAPQALSIRDVLVQARSKRSPLLPFIPLKHQFSFPLSARIPLSLLSVLRPLSALFVRVLSGVCFGCVGLASLSGRASLGLPLGCLGLCLVFLCLLCVVLRVVCRAGGPGPGRGAGPPVGCVRCRGPRACLCWAPTVLWVLRISKRDQSSD